jgi:hypothetical protein
MTTSVAGSFVIAVGAFTGLFGMWFMLAVALRAERNRPRRAPRTTVAHDQGAEAGRPGPAGGSAEPTIGPQRGGRHETGAVRIDP